MKSCSRAILASGLAICASLAYADSAPPPPPPPSPFSANVALTTDYVFRGISQTDSSPAIQGGFDFKHGSGLYLGTWGSNVNFNEDTSDGKGRRATMELDLYGGFSKEIVKDLSFDVGLYGYLYPRAGSARDDNYYEAYGGLTYKMFGIKNWYSPDFFGATGNADYLEGNLNFTLPYDVGLGLHLGYQWIEDNAKAGVPDYTDWKVSLSKTLGGFGFALSYVDTNINQSECAGGQTICGARAVFAISKSM
jgi:uncharacterized protein (TIGR02001 family)